MVGPIEATVAGDVFSFKQTNGPFTGEMTVSGDEMSGGGSRMRTLPGHSTTSQYSFFDTDVAKTVKRKPSPWPVSFDVAGR